MTKSVSKQNPKKLQAISKQYVRGRSATGWRTTDIEMANTLLPSLIFSSSRNYNIYAR